ncbi:tRNA-His guanylyltransferase [Lambiella insularis]|nr:tRNA-His guanylyltransferase [Lambiella insularis]
MANSRYEYVKSYEKCDTLLPSTYIVVRIDGRGFHKLSSRYRFAKPNDQRALHLMNAAANGVLMELPDICMAYGVSDEFRYLGSTATTDVMRFMVTALSSRKGATCSSGEKGHINNLYNTTFWALVEKAGLSSTQAEKDLKGSVAADKNEILFSRFGINYNNELDMFRKGSVVYRNYDVPARSLGQDSPDERRQRDETAMSKTQREKQRKKRVKASIVVEHIDLINDEFWRRRPWLLSAGPG